MAIMGSADLNAMREAEAWLIKKDVMRWLQYTEALRCICDKFYGFPGGAYHATAAQKSEAFLSILKIEDIKDIEFRQKQISMALNREKKKPSKQDHPHTINFTVTHKNRDAVVLDKPRKTALNENQKEIVRVLKERKEITIEQACVTIYVKGEGRIRIEKILKRRFARLIKRGIVRKTKNRTYTLV